MFQLKTARPQWLVDTTVARITELDQETRVSNGQT